MSSKSKSRKPTKFQLQVMFDEVLRRMREDNIDNGFGRAPNTYVAQLWYEEVLRFLNTEQYVDTKLPLSQGEIKSKK